MTMRRIRPFRFEEDKEYRRLRKKGYPALAAGLIANCKITRKLTKIEMEDRRAETINREQAESS